MSIVPLSKRSFPLEGTALYCSFNLRLCKRHLSRVKLSVDLRENHLLVSVLHQFVLLRDDCHLHVILFNLDCLFKVVVGLLYAIEALDAVVSHGEVRACYSWVVEDEPNHRFVALRVEFVVVSAFESAKVRDVVLGWVN